MNVKFCIHGAEGRVGKLFPEIVSEFSGLTLVNPLTSKSSLQDRELALSTADCVIDFTNAQASVEITRLACAHKKPILIGTTGHSPSQREQLKECAREIPVLLAANTSLGVHALKQISRVAKSILGAAYQIEISEIHHAKKKDAPSGTALSLANALVDMGAIVTSRAGGASARGENEIGISSVRGGDVFGEHTVFFFGKGERLELTHKVSDRGLFARGALHFAQKLLATAPGFYLPEDLIGG